MDALIPPSKISGLTQGMFVGSVSDKMCIRDRPYAGQPPIPLSIPMDAADKAYRQTAYDREDVSGGMGLLTELLEQNFK